MVMITNDSVVDKLKTGVKVMCVNFGNYKIMNCGELTIDTLLKCIDDSMCLFFTEN